MLRDVECQGRVVDEDVFCDEVRAGRNGKIINVLFANRLDGNDPVPIKFRIR